MSVYAPRLLQMYRASAIHEAIHKAVQTLGYDKPKKQQLDAIPEFVSGRDTFVSIPTGGGKSLCYACLPLVFDILLGL